MRGLLNAGFRRGRKVPRCIGKGSDQKVKEFNVFCPKALAGIGRLPHTIETRKIPVDLVRKRKSERVERFRLGAIPPEAKVIRERFESWASDTTVINKLRTARPHLPDALTDRQQDAWEPLLAIADMAGGEWPKRAREAAKELYSSSAPAMSETVLLLSNIKDAFGDAQQIHTETLLAAPVNRDDAPGPCGGAAISKAVNTERARFLRTFAPRRRSSPRCSRTSTFSLRTCALVMTPNQEGV